jgi:hypothetical protein
MPAYNCWRNFSGVLAFILVATILLTMGALFSSYHHSVRDDILASISAGTYIGLCEQINTCQGCWLHNDGYYRQCVGDQPVEWCTPTVELPCDVFYIDCLSCEAFKDNKCSQVIGGKKTEKARNCYNPE